MTSVFYEDLDSAQSGEQLFSWTYSRSAQMIKKYLLMLLKGASKMEVYKMETPDRSHFDL